MNQLERRHFMAMAAAGALTPTALGASKFWPRFGRFVGRLLYLAAVQFPPVALAHYMANNIWRGPIEKVTSTFITEDLVYPAAPRRPRQELSGKNALATATVSGTQSAHFLAQSPDGEPLTTKLTASDVPGLLAAAEHMLGAPNNSAIHVRNWLLPLRPERTDLVPFENKFQGSRMTYRTEKGWVEIAEVPLRLENICPKCFVVDSETGAINYPAISRVRVFDPAWKQIWTNEESPKIHKFDKQFKMG